MSKPKVGVIGTGRLGTALARSLVAAGYQVAVINSRGVQSLALQLSVLLPTVTARELPDLCEWADIIILAIPLPRFEEIQADVLKGKIVIDAMNYWAPVDGTITALSNAPSTSELVALTFSGARIVKTFNAVAYGEIEEQAMPQGNTQRRAIALVGNDAGAKRIVAEMIDAIGFDPVDLGDLAHGILFQPGTKLFNTRLTRADVISLVQSGS